MDDQREIRVRAKKNSKWTGISLRALPIAGALALCSMSPVSASFAGSIDHPFATSWRTSGNSLYAQDSTDPSQAGNDSDDSSQQQSQPSQPLGESWDQLQQREEEQERQEQEQQEQQTQPDTSDQGCAWGNRTDGTCH